MTPMECGRSPAPILSGTPLLQCRPNAALNHGRICPIAAVVAQHAAPVFLFTSHQSRITSH